MNRGFIATCDQLGVRLLIVSDLEEKLRHPVTHFEDDGFHFIGLREEPLENPFNRGVKRAIDFALALPIMLLIFPPLALDRLARAAAAISRAALPQTNPRRNSKPALRHLEISHHASGKSRSRAAGDDRGRAGLSVRQMVSQTERRRECRNSGTCSAAT